MSDYMPDKAAVEAIKKSKGFDRLLASLIAKQISRTGRSASVKALTAQVKKDVNPQFIAAIRGEKS
jgi:hypothetical protein